MKEEAAAQKHDRICDHDQIQAGQGPLDSDIRRPGRRPGLAARKTKDNVPANQASKQHRLGAEKRDHAEPANLWRSFGMAGVFTVSQNGCAHSSKLNPVEGDRFEFLMVA
jgi:hypothetical protein